ncbi:MAG: NAD(P)H-hydrate dehydratase [Deltaproteobacteria bacterium]|jgi:NAD(P)H-hydrate epimerase|nr:NAD(P)H-hydrate dehydratase [Deltaproteobacteria bacterium]
MHLSIPSYIATNAKSRALDQLAMEKFNFSGLVLMENAGNSILHKALELFPELRVPSKKISVLIGPGNNGGDGWVLSRLFHNLGHKVECYFVVDPGKRPEGDALWNQKIVKSLNIPILKIQTELDPLPDLEDTFLLIDALLGTGLHGTLSSKPILRVLKHVASLRRHFKVLAVDIPSGLSGDTGVAVAPVIRADLTVALATYKIGFFQGEGPKLCGSLALGDIGLSPEVYKALPCNGRLCDLTLLRNILPKRPRDGHKGTFGHAALCGGSPGKSGALVLSALGALRSGCGLVSAIHPESIGEIIATKLTSSMTISLPESEKHHELEKDSVAYFLSAIQEKNAVALGPGLGLSSGARDFTRAVVNHVDVPLVLDADALTHLVGHLSLLKKRRHPTVITPHPGEAGRLLSRDAVDIVDRQACAYELATKTEATVILKGFYTITMCPEGDFAINPTGDSILSTGGSGDLLTGLVCGLLARRMDEFHAAILAAFVHGRAAEIASVHLGPYGVSPTEIQPFIPKVWEELRGITTET